MSRKALIIGASSGIGEALAVELATQGWSLGLLARRTDRLQTLATRLRQAHGSTVVTGMLDVRAQDTVATAVSTLADALGGVDLIVVNAGISGSRKAGDGRLAIDRAIIETNLMGAIAGIDAAVACFLRQGSGHLVGISSLTALRGMPGIAAYTASKAALSNYLEAVGTEVRQRGIDVTIVHPGFVATDFAPNMERYPFVASPELVASEIVTAIARKARRVTVPRWPWAVAGPLLRILPDGLLRKVF